MLISVEYEKSFIISGPGMYSEMKGGNRPAHEGDGFHHNYLSNLSIQAQLVTLVRFQNFTYPEPKKFKF